jgi:hypothetical protein
MPNRGKQLSSHRRTYEPLQQYLEQAPGKQVVLTFADVEALLGTPLPPGAWHTRSWWANVWASSQGYAWVAAGWRVVAVSCEGQTVTFVRVAADG